MEKQQTIKAIRLSKIAPQDLVPYKDEPDVMMELFVQKSPHIESLGDELRQDHGFMRSAFMMDERAIRLLPPYFFESEDFVLDTLPKSAKYAHLLSAEVRSLPSVMFRLWNHDKNALNHMSDELQSRFNDLQGTFGDDIPKIFEYLIREVDKHDMGSVEAAYEYIKIDPYLLQYAEESVRDDEQLMLAALQIAPRALQYASARLKGDLQFLEKALPDDPRYAYATNNLPKEVLNDLVFAKLITRKQYPIACLGANLKRRIANFQKRHSIANAAIAIEYMLQEQQAKETKKALNKIVKRAPARGTTKRL